MLLYNSLQKANSTRRLNTILNQSLLSHSSISVLLNLEERCLLNKHRKDSTNNWYRHSQLPKSLSRYRKRGNQWTLRMAIWVGRAHRKEELSMWVISSYHSRNLKNVTRFSLSSKHQSERIQSRIRVFRISKPPLLINTTNRYLFKLEILWDNH